jgi:Na+/melibiose symporter-like transporter
VEPPRRDRLDSLWQVLGTVATGAVVIGAFAALAGWSPAAWILVAVVAAAVVGHLVVAILRYRKIMRRPWPKVEPLPDDDDDW